MTQPHPVKQLELSLAPTVPDGSADRSATNTLSSGERPPRRVFRPDEKFEMQNTRHNDHRTSITAAQLAYQNAGRHREIALTAHYAHPAGLTDFELAALVGISQPSIGKRRLDLQRDGMIEYAGVNRPAPSGTPARVYKITAKGKLRYQTLQNG